MEEQVIVGLSEGVLARIDTLAQKIGVTVEQLWPWLVKQQYVEAFWALSMFSLSLIVGIFILRFILKTDYAGFSKYSEPTTARQVIGIILGILTGFGFIVAFIFTIQELPDVLNPKYWALRDLMAMIK